MTEHYYTNQPNAKHEVDIWSYELLGNKLTFKTDSGVFSRRTVDYGSRVLLEAIDIEGLPEGAILDVGCGYGPIGLALAKVSSRNVEMVDVNLRALELANKNAESNNLSNLTNIHQSYIYENIEGSEFAAVISNPPIRAGKEVVHEILSGAYSKLRSGGSLYIVIQKKQGAPSAKKKMEEVFGNATVISKDKGYYIIESVKA